MIISVERAHCLTDNLFVVLKHCKGFWYAYHVVPYVILFCLQENNCCCLVFGINLFFLYIYPNDHIIKNVSVSVQTNIKYISSRADFFPCNVYIFIRL